MAHRIEIARRKPLARRSLLRAVIVGSVLARYVDVAAANEPIGSVADARGDVFKEVRSDHVALEATAPLFIKDVVGTGAESRATLRLGANTVIRMGANAVLTIDRFLANAGGEIILQSGPILYDHDESAPPAHMKIRSAFGPIAVRGTRFFAGPSAGVFGVFVERGSVIVTTAAAGVEVDAGQGTNIERVGANPTSPAPW